MLVWCRGVSWGGAIIGLLSGVAGTADSDQAGAGRAYSGVFWPHVGSKRRAKNASGKQDFSPGFR